MQARTATLNTYSRTLLALAVVTGLTAGAPAGTWSALATSEPEVAAPTVTVHGYDDLSVDLTVDFHGVQATLQRTPAGEFLVLRCPDSAVAGDIGAPALPVVRYLIYGPPEGAGELVINTAPAELVDLGAYGGALVMPMQPPAPVDEAAEAVFHYDAAAYATAEPLPTERVTLTKAGIMRGHHLYLLEVRPVVYDATTNALTVWPRIDVRIAFAAPCRPEAASKPLPRLRGTLLNPPTPAGRPTKNYTILVSDAALAGALGDFVTAKEARGFDVNVLQVTPGLTNTEYKAQIEALWGTPDAPDYLLIVGDGADWSGDYVIPGFIGGGDRTADTDLPYACMDGPDDWVPDFPVGRFSVRTVAQLQAVIAKTLYVESGVFSDPSYVTRATFIATNDMDSGAEETHNWVVDTYMDPYGFSSTKLYCRLGASTQDVRDAFNGGCVYGVYYGHSWTASWRDPEFSHADVQGLTNQGMYTFLFHFTCDMGRYADIFVDPGFTERWLREPNKGAAANIGASRTIYYMSNPGWPETSNLEKFLFDTIYLDGEREVSPAWQGALARLLTLYGPLNPVTRDYHEMFNLMGDPSLRIPAPGGFSLEADPEEEYLCTPPETSVQYAIDVIPDGGFASTVTLSAEGQPAGSTVQFSINDAVPPFTSVMTISNIPAGASPGVYYIQVTGEAAGQLETADVVLNLSSAVPGAVVLSSPPDGAEDVERSPTLVWQAATQAIDYTLQVATDEAFTDVVYTTTVTETSHPVGALLDTGTLHYWRVRASNGCGDSGYPTPFTFTTVAQPDYFTEFFNEDDFDLDNFSLTFSPDGSTDYYEICGGSATELPVTPAGGTAITLDDDGYAALTLQSGQTVELYGVTYTQFYVGSNGYITFGSGDLDELESLVDHFRLPRISALFHDLSPNISGQVSWRQLDDRAVVTYENVPEYNTSNTNTFQIEMFFDGAVRVTWLNIDVENAMVGLSEGTGIPLDYIESNLSDSTPCYEQGDMDCNGLVNNFDIRPFLMAVLDPDRYAEEFPGCDINLGDFTGDGLVNNFDIRPFIHKLAGK
ncbi:MAG: C25 family cysteine peptidase [Phycisphaerae bacterium]|jgi:hypothetical protein